MGGKENKVTCNGKNCYLYMREHWLQIVFALTLTWAVFPLLTLPMDWVVRLSRLNEGDILHIWVEHLTFGIVVLIMSFSTIAIILHIAPDFLRVSSKMKVSWLLLSLLVSVPLVFITVLAIFIALGIFVEPPPWPSDNPQYIPIVFYLAGIGPYLITPAASIIAGWMWTRRHIKGAE